MGRDLYCFWCLYILPLERVGKGLDCIVTKKAISKTPYAVIPAKAGIQYFQGVLDCPIKSGNDNEGGFTNGLLSKFIMTAICAVQTI